MDRTTAPNPFTPTIDRLEWARRSGSVLRGTMGGLVGCTLAAWSWKQGSVLWFLICDNQHS